MCRISGDSKGMTEMPRASIHAGEPPTFITNFHVKNGLNCGCGCLDFDADIDNNKSGVHKVVHNAESKRKRMHVTEQELCVLVLSLTFVCIESK